MDPSPVVAPAIAEGAEQPPTEVSFEDHALATLSPRRLILQMLTGGVAPLVTYELGKHAGLSDPTALATSAVPPALAIGAEWLWRRQINVIGTIVLTGILLGLASVAVFHGNELLLKMRESVVTGMFGLICLVTLVLPMRPAMFHVGRALASAADREKGREFATLWDVTEARRVFIVLTLVWGLGLLVEAGARAVLALELSTGRFLATAPVAGWIVIGSLLAWTFSYSRRSRQRGEAAAQAAPETVVAG